MAADTNFELTDRAVTDLMYVAEHPEEARQVEIVIRDTTVPKTFPELFNLIASRTSIPQSAVEKIVRMLVAFHQLKTELGLSADELFDSLTEQVDRIGSQEWRDTKKAEWINNRSVIINLLNAIGADGESLAILQKTSQLIYAFQNILRTTRIITDVRPVLATDTKQIARAIIIHKLLIEYTDSDIPMTRRIELALDAADVSELRTQCERAEEKSVLLRDSLAQLKWNPIIPRDGNDSK